MQFAVGSVIHSRPKTNDKNLLKRVQFRYTEQRFITDTIKFSRHNTDHVIKDEHNSLIIVVLAKHELAPWWWFLREPKHVGATVRILIVFNIPMIL